MYERNGIIYADDPTPILRVKAVRPLVDHQLWIRFNTGEEKIFDFRPYLAYPAFRSLKDQKVSESVYVDYGCPVWNDGEIDMAPERLYQEGVCQESQAAR